MKEKYVSDVLDYDEHISPYRVVQLIAGVGSGKNTWVEKVLMKKYKVLLVTSRKSKVEETHSRLGLKKSININALEKQALNQLIAERKINNSCVCNNWQIEYYMKNFFDRNNPTTYLWKYFDLIIVDECHSLATDATYCDAPFYLYDFLDAVYINSDKKIILMTATFDSINGLLKFKDYKLYDLRKECRNIKPEKIFYVPTENALRNIIYKYQIAPNGEWHFIYFATKISHIKNKILPFLVDNGIPEEKIAVSFSKDEDEKCFSSTIIANKTRTEKYLKNKEDLPSDIKVFITTSRNKEGININNANFEWHIIIESYWKDEIEQMWGRVRSNMKFVTIAYDALQHQKHICDMDFNYMFCKKYVKEINGIFNKWCVKNGINIKDRYKNIRAAKKSKT